MPLSDYMLTFGVLHFTPNGSTAFISKPCLFNPFYFPEKERPVVFFTSRHFYSKHQAVKHGDNGSICTPFLHIDASLKSLSLPSSKTMRRIEQVLTSTRAILVIRSYHVPSQRKTDPGLHCFALCLIYVSESLRQ